jgi:hypothetical protein
VKKNKKFAHYKLCNGKMRTLQNFVMEKALTTKVLYWHPLL